MKIRLFGMALDERLRDGRESVQTDWSDQVISISCQTDQQLNLQLEIASCSFELGGNKNSFLFILHPSLGKTQIYVEITSEFRKFVSQHQFLRQQLRSELRDSRRSNTSNAIILIAIISTLVLIFAFRSPIAKAIVNLVPFSTEKKIADKVISFREKATSEQKASREKLNELLKVLYHAYPEWRQTLTFHISSDKMINAYATLGGHIFINRGLIDRLETPEQLLGVIAHEITHAHDRHVAHSLIQGTGLFLVVQALLGDVTGLAAVLADQGVPLFLMKHSRDLETEADRYAVDTLLKAGVNPRGLVEALHILDEESKKLIKDTPLENAEKVFSKLELWSTHPNMNTRIEEIEKYISSHKHPQQDLRIEFDYSAFRKAVQANY